MFGLKAFFASLSRLAASINRSADLFDAANEHLAAQLACDETPALEHDPETPAINGTSKRRKTATT